MQCQILNVFNRVAVPAPDAVAGDPFCLHPAAGPCLLLQLPAGRDLAGGLHPAGHLQDL